MRSNQGRAIWILLAIIGLFVVVAVVSGAAYLVLRQRPGAVSDWTEPVSAVAADEIAPDLAIYPLAGASELETIDAAIANGDLETAYAALVLNADISDPQRIGRFILLGRRFEQAGNSTKAGLSYQQIADVAVLSPTLSDPARADALFASGTGWATLGRKTRALDAFDQVYLIAVRSPYLHLAYRRDLLVLLESAYADLGESEQAEAARQRIIELDQGTQLQVPRQPRAVPDVPVAPDAVSSPEVGALEEARRQAAYDLVQSLGAGEEPPADLVSALSAALQAEDAAKTDLYRQELGATTQLGRRIGLHQQLIRWLTLKYRVASRGFGLSIVPEWEAGVADIQSALSKAYEDLYFDNEDLVASLPEAALMAPGSYQIRRQVIQAGRLGQYPNYPERQLAEKLQSAASSLIAAGSLDELYVDMTDEDGALYFFLSPADQYGLRGQAQ